VNSIRDEPVALDTNEFIFALRGEPLYPACRTLLFDRLNELKVYMPLQILIELQRNLQVDEMRGVLRALARANSLTWDYAPPRAELVREWEQRGAKKGDAVVVAHLQANGIHHFVSENRHFLAELTGLPFEVLSSEEVLQRLP
jgi:hypothetical protein